MMIASSVPITARTSDSPHLVSRIMSLPAQIPTARIAQTVGIGLSSFLAGEPSLLRPNHEPNHPHNPQGKTYHSTIMARIFQDAPSVESGKRWREMAKEAMVASPVLTVLSSAALAYLAYLGKASRHRRPPAPLPRAPPFANSMRAGKKKG